MPVPLAMTKLRNRIRAIDPTLRVELKNIRVNGRLLGCSGFIVDPTTGSTVYVCTDNNHGMNHEACYRTARDTKDYSGGRNHFATYEALPQAVVDLVRGGTASDPDGDLFGVGCR